MAQQQPLVRLRLQKGDTIVDEITIADLADLQDQSGETWGYDPNALVYVPVKPNKRDPKKGSNEKKKNYRAGCNCGPDQGEYIPISEDDLSR